MVVLSSVLFALLEYRYMGAGLVPSREATLTLVGPFYAYQVEVFLPVIGMLAFYPFLHGLAKADPNPEWSLRQRLALGAASFMIGAVVEDAAWFFLRAYLPSSLDPLAHRWIIPSDPTAYVAGYADIYGLVIPLWYIVALAPALAVLVALFILPED